MTKEKLRQYGWLMKNVALLEDQLAELETKATSTTINIKQDMISGGCSEDKMSGQVAQIVDLKNQINQKLEKAYAIRQKIEEAIEVLDEREKLLVRLKYIQCKTWEEVAVEMGYTWQHTHKIHAKCLDDLKEVIECDI